FLVPLLRASSPPLFPYATLFRSWRHSLPTTPAENTTRNQPGTSLSCKRQSCSSRSLPPNLLKLSAGRSKPTRKTKNPEFPRFGRRGIESDERSRGNHCRRSCHSPFVRVYRGRGATGSRLHRADGPSHVDTCSAAVKQLP